MKRTHEHARALADELSTARRIHRERGIPFPRWADVILSKCEEPPGEPLKSAPKTRQFATRAKRRG